MPFCGSRFELPFLIGDFDDLRRSVSASEHQVPHTAYRIKTLWVFQNPVSSLVLIPLTVLVAERGTAWIPSHSELCLQSSPHILAQLADILVRHTAFNAENDGVVLGQIFTSDSMNRADGFCL